MVAGAARIRSTTGRRTPPDNVFAQGNSLNSPPAPGSSEGAAVGGSPALGWASPPPSSRGARGRLLGLGLVDGTVRVRGCAGHDGRVARNGPSRIRRSTVRAKRACRGSHPPDVTVARPGRKPTETREGFRRPGPSRPSGGRELLAVALLVPQAQEALPGPGSRCRPVAWCCSRTRHCAGRPGSPPPSRRATRPSWSPSRSRLDHVAGAGRWAPRRDAVVLGPARARLVQSRRVGRDVQDYVPIMVRLRRSLGRLLRFSTISDCGS